MIRRSSKIFSITVDGISKSDIKLLKKNSRQVIKLNEEVDVLQDKIFNYLKSNEKGNEKATELYLVILEKLTQTTKNLRKISRRTLKHVEEDRRKLPLSNIKILLNLENTFNIIYNNIFLIFEEKNYEKIKTVLLEIIESKEEIENQITNYNTANKEKGKYDLLHLDILQLSSEILVSLKELLENFYSINSKS